MPFTVFFFSKLLEIFCCFHLSEIFRESYRQREAKFDVGRINIVLVQSRDTCFLAVSQLACWSPVYRSFILIHGVRGNRSRLWKVLKWGENEASYTVFVLLKIGSLLLKDITQLQGTERSPATWGPKSLGVWRASPHLGVTLIFQANDKSFANVVALIYLQINSSFPPPISPFIQQMCPMCVMHQELYCSRELYLYVIICVFTYVCRNMFFKLLTWPS